MALGWFKKKKNKNASEAVDEQDEPAQNDEEQVSIPGDQEISAEKLAEQEDPQADSGETTVTDPEDESEENASADPGGTGYFKRLKNRLTKTRQNLSDGFEKAFAGKKRLDEDALEELEELLITSDIGVQSTMKLIERIAKAKVADAGEVKEILKNEMLSILDAQPPAVHTNKDTPHVILVVGVNGVGKTTTIGKIAASFKTSGKKVMTIELTSPKGTDISKFQVAIDKVRAANVDFVNVPDGARASTRVSSLHLAAYINSRPENKVTVIPHLTTRDRNLIALQADLLGAYVNNVHDILITDIARQDI